MKITPNYINALEQGDLSFFRSFTDRETFEKVAADLSDPDMTLDYALWNQGVWPFVGLTSHYEDAFWHHRRNTQLSRDLGMNLPDFDPQNQEVCWETRHLLELERIYYAFKAQSGRHSGVP